MKKVFTQTRDADLLILEKLDDESLIRTCSVNQYLRHICDNETFWKNRLEKNYSDAIPFRNGMNYKNLYLFIVKYLSMSKGNIDYAMLNAAYEGNKNLVEYFISKGAKDFDEGLKAAAEGGHINLVDYFLNKGAITKHVGLDIAARNGDKNLIEFLLSKGAGRGSGGFSHAFYAAIQGNHLDLVKFFAEKEKNFSRFGDAYILGRGLRLAKKLGYKDIVDYLLSLGANENAL